MVSPVNPWEEPGHWASTLWFLPLLLCSPPSFLWQQKISISLGLLQIKLITEFLRFLHVIHHLFSLSTSHLAQEKLPEEERFYFPGFSALWNCSREKKRGKDPIMCLQDDNLKLMCLPWLDEKKIYYFSLEGWREMCSGYDYPLGHVHTWSSHYFFQLAHTLFDFEAQMS